MKPKKKDTERRSTDVEFLGQKELERTEAPSDAKRQTSVLAKYVIDSGKGLTDEANRAFYYLVGAGLLFIVLAIPLARFFLEPAAQYLVWLPGLLVILLAFLRELRRHPPAPAAAAPTSPDATVDRVSQPTTLGKVTLRGQIPESTSYEIVMYWGYRPAAHQDIGRAIEGCKGELFVAGLGLNTITDTLNEPQLLDALSRAIRNNDNFAITIVFLHRAQAARSREEGGQNLSDSIRQGKRKLRRFHAQLSERVQRRGARPLVDFRTYDQKTIPRHFLLKVDDVIYVGSYLCHEKGSYSYLLKIQDYGDGLYSLFCREIDYLRKHSVAIQYIPDE